MIYLAQRAALEDILRDVSEVPLPVESGARCAVTHDLSKSKLTTDLASIGVDDVDFTSLPDGKASAVCLMMRLLGETRDDDPVFKSELIPVINIICGTL